MNHRRITCLLMSLAVCLGMVRTAFAATARDFPDYDNRVWYADAVRAAVEHDLLRGDDRGLLRPEDHLSRAEMAAIINRAFGAYKKADITRFKDVDAAAWYYDDVRMAVQIGTYNGTSSSTMAPNTPITRQEAMTVVARALQLDLVECKDFGLARFRDYTDISAWAVPYVKAMVAAGYIQGNERRQLTPRDHITRAEFAQIFHNILKEYISKEGIYTGDRDGSILVRTDAVTLKDMTISGDLIVGCGAANGTVILDNVTITGRVVVWGGGTEAVYMNNGTCSEDLIVCRVDDPVKVIFDKESTLAVHDRIRVDITERASEFKETEVIFYDISAILDAVERLNKIVSKSTVHCSISSDFFALVDDTKISGSLSNNSPTDTYTVQLFRSDTGAPITDKIHLRPGHILDTLQLKDKLPMGSYTCTAVVSKNLDGKASGTVELSVTLHVAYLWAR